MTIVVLLLLAIAWAMILVPPALRARAESRPSDSIVTFRRQLRVLQRTAPGGSPAEGGGQAPLHVASRPQPVAASNVYPIGTAYSLSAARARTLKRRRDVLTTLLIGMSVTLVLGFMPGFRMAWALHVFLDALFAVYVGLLIKMRNQAAEREMKLRFLPRSAPAPQPALLLRRSAN